jgi:hypothetical protein
MLLGPPATALGCLQMEDASTKGQSSNPALLGLLVEGALDETDDKDGIDYEGSHDHKSNPVELKCPPKNKARRGQKEQGVAQAVDINESKQQADSKKKMTRDRASRRRQSVNLVVKDDEDYYDVERENANRKKKQKTSTKGLGRGPEEIRTCPHCQKLCSTKHGLKYHLGKSIWTAIALIDVDRESPNSHNYFVPH